MQTLTLEVQDDFVPNLLEYLKQFKSEVKVQQDKNLEYDPCFYERQKELHKIRDDIKNKNIEMVSHEKVWGSIKQHLNIIENE
ncbi:MAG: hypothetical protein ACOCP1_02355 [Campylobacterales bacterium]